MSIERIRERLALIGRMKAGGLDMSPSFSEQDVIDLIAEINRLNDGTLAERYDQLQAETESLRKDAVRYRWTSIEGNWVARMFGRWRAHIGEYGEASPTKWYETREEAIDAAMAHEATQPLNPA